MKNGSQRSKVRGQKLDRLRTLGVVITGFTLLALAGLNSPHTANPPPPPLTTVTLAGFRGLTADLLWLRAADLQDKGRYFELVQLADWITTLEPRFAEIWALQAWNMAYNISVMMPTDSDRWRWVQNGITLLRDRGIRHCPNQPLLYHELGWLFFHKIGSNSDLAASYYKREWAKQIMALLGQEGKPDYATLQHRADSTTHLQDYGLDPAYMMKLDSQYGPLDWRVAETHALYWASLGAIANPDHPSPMCERMICQSMVALFNHGRLTYSKDGDLFVTSPEFDLLPNIIKTFEDAIAGASNELPAEAFASFLASAIQTLKFYQHGSEARALFQRLHNQFPSERTQRGFDAFTQGNAAQLPQILSAP